MKMISSIHRYKNATKWLKLLTVCALMFFPLSCKSLLIDEKKSTQLTIVAFGDSITAPRKNVSSVFAQRLPYLLAASGINATVVNAGIGGSHSGRLSDNSFLKIKHGLDRFQDDVLSKNPDLVVIGFGTNDAYIDSKTADGSSRIPLNKYKENLIYMVKSLKRKGSKVILIAPNPLGKNRPAYQNERLFEYAQAVREISKTLGTGLVDNYKAFQNFHNTSDENLDDLLLDSVHPNDRGHEIIALMLHAQILNQIKTKI